MYMTNVLADFGCWIAHHPELSCGRNADDVHHGLGWVGERTKQSSVYADDYLYLLLRTVTGSLSDVKSLHPGPIPEGDDLPHIYTYSHASPFDPRLRLHGVDWPAAGLTMAGKMRLAALHDILVRCEAEGVSGDYVEAGAWRGGASIFAAGVIRRRQMQRTVFACDSYPAAATAPPPPAPHQPSHPSPASCPFAADCSGDRGVLEAFSKVQVLQTLHAFGFTAASSAVSESLTADIIVVNGSFQETLPSISAEVSPLSPL